MDGGLTALRSCDRDDAIGRMANVPLNPGDALLLSGDRMYVERAVDRQPVEQAA